MSDLRAEAERGRLRIIAFVGSGFTWQIEILQAENNRCDVSVDSKWRYASENSARAAARRWAKRLKITLKEPANG